MKESNPAARAFDSMFAIVLQENRHQAAIQHVRSYFLAVSRRDHASLALVADGDHETLSRAMANEVSSLRTKSADEQTQSYSTASAFLAREGHGGSDPRLSWSVPQGHETVGLVIVDSGPQADELCHLARADRRIKLIAAQTGISPFYRAFDVYVSAARLEPFGFTISLRGPGPARAHGCQVP